MWTAARTADPAVTAGTTSPHPPVGPESCASGSADCRCRAASGTCYSPGSEGCFSVSVCRWVHSRRLVSHPGLCQVYYQLKMIRTLHLTTRHHLEGHYIPVS